MPIVAFEALLAIERKLSMAEAARFIRDLLDRRPPPGEPLVPLPYARKFWNEAAPPVVSSAPMLGLKEDVAERGDSAWPVSIQRFSAAGRTAIVLSVDIKPPFGSVADGWAWFRDWIAVIVGDGAIAYAAINGSGNDDAKVAGEGLPPLRLLDQPIPAAVAPWFFIGKGRIDRAGEQPAKVLRELAAATLDTGLIFAPSPDFATPIAKHFVEAYGTVAGHPVEIFQGKLP
jgi:hypothetical protein